MERAVSGNSYRETGSSGNGSARPPRALTIRTYLIVLVSGLLLPAFLFSAFLLLEFAARERAHLDAQAGQIAVALAADLNREISTHSKVLDALATSEELDEGDLADFHAQATQAMGVSGSNIILLDPSLRQLANTGVAYGTTLPGADDPECARKALTTQKDVVSKLVRSSTTHRLAFELLKPVVRQGEVRYILSLVLEPTSILDVLHDQSLPQEWNLVVVDQDGQVVASLLEHDEHVGRPYQPTLAELGALKRPKESVDPEGRQVLRAVAPFDTADWFVTATVPLEKVSTAVRASWLAFGLTALGLLAASLLFAVSMSRTLARPVHDLARAAAALGRGEPMPQVAASLSEANGVAEALQTARLELARRTLALRQRERLVRTATQHARVGIAVLDKDWRHTFINPFYAELFGLEKHLVIGKAVEETLGPFVDQIHAVLEQAFEEGEGTALELAASPPPGEREQRWFSIAFEPEKDGRGDVVGMVVVAIDVTARKKAELANAHLAAIVASSGDAINSFSLDGIVLSWNPAAEHLFGYTHDEIIGQPISLIVPEDRVRETETKLEAVKAGQSVRIETSRRHKDGSLIDVSLDASPILTPEGHIIGVSIIAHDISEKKAWERHRELMARELVHRVKNSLAVIEAVVRQTLRSATDPDKFAEAVTGRIAALAASHDVLIDADWKGAELTLLIRRQLAPYLGLPEDQRMKISGPEVTLPTVIAVPIGLAIHELATNAAKYGALSVPTGSVDLTWSLQTCSGEKTLKVEWREQGGPPVTPPDKTGFGSRLIQHGIPNGRAERQFAPEGVRCTIELTLGPAPGFLQARS